MMMDEKKRLSSKTWGKRLLSFVLALAMMVTLLPTSGLSVAKAADGTGGSGKVLYLKPNANWKSDGARFAAYFFGNGEKWIDMADSDADGYYEVTVPSGYPNVIFCRMNPSTTANNWNNKWNQSADLTVPTDEKNFYTVAEGAWDKGSGSWSVYAGPVYTVAGQAELCGSDWNTADTANEMTLNEQTGKYEKVYQNVSAGTYEFKVAVNHSWDVAWGNNNDNVSHTVAENGSTVTISFDPATRTVSAASVKVCKVTLNGINVTITGDETVNKGAGYTATLTVGEGYLLPESVQVTSGEKPVEHTYSGGQLIVPNVTGDLTITAKGIAVYSVSLNGTNVTITGETTVKEGVNYTATLKAAEGYVLPAEISVTTNSEVVTHQYNDENGTLIIPAENIKGNLVIKAVGVKEVVETKTIYLNANGGGMWEQGNAWFMAWAWKTGGDGVAYKMTDDDDDGVYQTEIPVAADNIIFLRKDPANTGLNWENVWNQTGDLSIAGNYFTITAWGNETDSNCTGVWSQETYAPSAPIYTVVGQTGLCGSDWSLTDTDNDMAEKVTGVYEKVYTNVKAGEYQFKVALNHSWNRSWGDVNSSNGNVFVTVEKDDSTVAIIFDATAKTISVNITENYKVNFKGTNVTSAGTNSVMEGNGYNATLQAKDGYKLPKEIVITVGDQQIAADDYSYDSTTGELSIDADAITDDVTITAEAELLGNITIYLNAGGSSLWDQAGAWFSAKVDGVWYKLVDKDLDGDYQVDIPENAKKVTFYRNDPSKTAMEESSAWNYTNELDIEGNCYTITGWSDTAVCSGRWTTDTSLDEPTSFTLTVAGELGSVSWDPAYTENDMTLNSESGLYEKTFTNVAAGTYKYKVVKNHAWTQAWGGNVDKDGNAAVTVDKDGSTVTITFDVIERKVNAIVTEPSSGDEGDTPAPKETYTVTFHFANTIGWSPVNLYVWNDDGATVGSWPGTAITQRDEDGYHTMTVTYEAATNKGMNYIFNNGAAQTVDLSVAASAFNADNTAELWVELNTTANSDGKYVTKQVSDEVLEDVLLAVSPQITTENNVTSVTFEYVNSSAISVEVRGTIPGATWDSGIKMTKNTKGIWTVTVNDFPPAVYEYKFFVNGKDWYADPANGKTNSGGNSVFTITDPTAQDTNEVKINVFYKRGDNVFVVENADGTDTGTWNAYVWGDGVKAGRWDFALDEKDVNGNGDKTEMVTTITVKGRECQNVYLKPRMSTSTKDWLREESQVSISVGNIVSGTINVYVVSNGTNGNKGDMTYSVVTDKDIVVGNKIIDVQYDYDTEKIKVTALEALDPAELKWVASDGSKVTDVAVSGTTYTLTLDAELNLTTLYQYKIAYDQDAKGKDYVYDIGIDTVYASKKFAEEFTYTGKDLGAIYSANKTTFKVWAPTAETVSVNLYTSGTMGTSDLIKSVAMTKDVNGTWVVTVDGDQNGVYYTYSVKVNGETIEAVDPYARTTGVNGNRGMVIDLSKTEPADGWTELTNKPANYTDAVIYELHVRDFSIDDSSGVKDEWQGKFLGLTQSGTTIPDTEIATGLDYLKGLGITHLHLLPIYDYASVKEDKLDTPQFNWGYDPQNYNVPEGSYSTNPYDGATRVKEMKEMVDTLHENNIGVIMDVVYNHVYDADTFSMNRIVPGYFSRVDSNTSGCGNDTASEREMVRKFIVESVLYWAQEYHIDGFRFDLVGLIDVETINQIVTEVHAIRPDVIFYGEGWDMDGTNKEPGTEMAKQGNAGKTPGFAYFSDNMRNLLGGDNGKSTGFVSGATGQEGGIVSNFLANPWWTNNPNQVVQYASCHDNYTLIDKLIISTGARELDIERDSNNIIKMNNLAAAIYMTAQGIPFIHAGEEMLREKLDENNKRCENSYNASDYVNHIEWSNLEDPVYAANSAYYKGLIAFRKAHPALSLDKVSDIQSYVVNQEASGNVVSFWIDGRNVTGETHDSIYVIFNANVSAKTVTLPSGTWEIHINGVTAGTTAISTATGTVNVPGISAMVLVQKESEESPVSKSNVALPGSFNNWNQANFMDYVEGSKTVVTQTIDLPAGTYKFKVKNGNDWFGNNGTIVDTTVTTSATGWDMDGSAGDCTLQVSGNGGTYTFTYDTTTKKLIIERASNGASFNPNEYFLYGYINNVDYAMGIETGNYKFGTDGKLTVTFEDDSYVCVKNGDSSKKYMTKGWLGSVASAVMHNVGSGNIDGYDKMMVPGGYEVTFTLGHNNDGTVTLSYEADPGLERDTSGIQNGVTLHAWNWSFEEIEANMEKIAEMGYTAVQTSPVQPLKESTNDADDTVGLHWWVYYQPIDFVITTDDGNALGTKEDLASMIETAHEYGIKVIVDVVANHLANETGNDLAEEIPEYLLKDEYWHNYKKNISNYDDRYDMTQYCMGGLPDLNTGNAEIQGYVLAFLKGCIDLGVDGFRFDATKHIETPNDSAGFASDFWPVVAGGAEEYAKTKGKDLYLYGEVLDDPAIAAYAYTKYMSITDNSWGNTLRGNVATGSALLNAGYNKAVDASNLVIWAESHDTFATDDATQKSSGISEADINKTWALVAARADAMGLYLARPESMDQALGVASATGWDNLEVKAVNKFHNAFDGQDEVVSNENGISYVERGTTGVVLVNVSATSNTVSVTANAMADGTYTDQITGNIFTVANGKISGTIGETGIAVVYNLIDVTITGKVDTTITYSEETYDVSKLFTIDENAGPATYEIVTGGTGEAVLNGTALTVSKVGTIIIKVTTEATDAYAAGEATATLAVNKAIISDVTVTVTAPEAGANPQSTVEAGTGYSAAIQWDTDATTFGFNTAYTATVTLTPDDNHEFIGNIGVSGWNGNMPGGIFTLTKTYEATRKAEVQSIKNPLAAQTLTQYYTTADAAMAELPTTVTYTTESGDVTVEIQWTCENYDPTVDAENTFTWTVKDGELAQYANTAVIATTGDIVVTNAAALAVTVTGTDAETTYSGEAYDVSDMFAIDENAGAATYEIVTGGTGEAELNGTALTVSKVGTITIKVTTAASGAYAAGEATATLTVAKKDIAGATITLGEELTYTGDEQAQAITGVGIDGLTVTYTVSGEKATHVGAYELTVTGTDNFTGTAKITYMVYPNADLLEAIADLTVDNVTSADQDAIAAAQTMMENADTTLVDEAVKEQWAAIVDKCEALTDKIETAADAVESDAINKVEDVTSADVAMEDKTDLESAKAELEKALEDHESNYTPTELAEIKAAIQQIDSALKVIENVEAAEEKITTLTTVTLPDPAKVEPGNEEEAQAIEVVVAAYEALSEYEKSLVDEELKSKLDALVAATTDYKIVEGHDQDWHEDSEHHLHFRANGHFSKFKGIRINGTPIDAKHYTAQAGSVILTLHAEFLDTLPVGEYKLEVVYENNNVEYSAQTTFDIKAPTSGGGAATPEPEQPTIQPEKPSQPEQPAQQPNQSTNAPTGDESPIMLYGMLALAALAVMAEAERRRRRA